MKTHVLTFAKHFMKDHPREGEPTDFEQKIIDTIRHDKPAKKLHTIRGNYPYWKKRIDEVNQGEAILSLRNWKGKPYRSKQNEFFALSRAGYQKIKIANNIPFVHPRGDKLDKPISDTVTPGIREVANNDGLTKEDFLNWFEQPMEGIIIHFTDFRY